MIRLSFVVLALFLAGPALAGSPDPKSLDIPAEELSRARELVQQLGSEDYAEREQAEQELAKMGRLARPALLEAANTDPNQEIRSRASGLLPRATALDFKARLDVFLADADGKYEHDVPGWEQFRGLLRNEWSLFGHEVWADRSHDRAARAVYAEMLSSQPNRQILMAVNGSRSTLSAIALVRRQELHAQKFPRTAVRGRLVVSTGSTIRRDPTVEDIATLLFAESLTPALSRFVPRGVSITNLITASGYPSASKEDDEKGKVYRTLASTWIESRTDPGDMYQAMSVAGNLGLTEEGCRLGARLLASTGAMGNLRGMAATNLARLGSKEHIPLLEKAFADTAVAYTIRGNTAGPLIERPTHDVQVRDMALGAAVVLSGQKLEDYGFVDNFRNSGGVSSTAYDYNRFYIPDKKRDEMHKKWQDWRARNP
jgi:hypothetical protein